ncbi:MAG: hypothetical protein LBK03_04100, partial [Bacteroidales bacterium]|nr:hypothetical protein [Bacteroidales bacterium]
EHVTARALGRIYWQEDATGYQKYAYDALGNISENIRTFVPPNEGHTYTFAMRYRYDSWGRITDMGYPDGENVHYAYNLAGDLYAMNAKKWNSTTGNTEYFRYIDSISYNKFGQKSKIWYGNGTRAEYSYDYLQRLQFLSSYTQANIAMQNITYTYDSVSNITFMSNSAAPLANGMGGNYYNFYQYDELYRLIYSNGSGTINSSNYTLGMVYSLNGKILTKYTNFSGSRHYSYNNGTNKIASIGNGSVTTHGFSWDTNGNMATYVNPSSGHSHYWDEENRLMLMSSYNQFGYYMYDASGERTYKLNGNIEQYNVNGQPHYYTIPTMATLYVSPYLVANSQNYTKHYYAGTERVASKLGGGGITGIHTPIVNTDYKRNSWETPYANLWNNSLNLAPPCSSFLSYSSMNQTTITPETDLYFYHPDHLGSASWITDSAGKAIQHLQYLPFGELVVNQRTTDWSTRYSFSAKEKDEESGYSYFGARYYNSDLSVFLSVDPQSASHPSTNNYMYCLGNPLRLVDPNGEDEWEFDESGKCLNPKNQPIKNTDNDIIRIKKADGTSVEKSYEYGTINAVSSASGEDTKGTTQNIDFLKIKGDDNSKDAFEFVANNTNVEWSQTLVGNKSGDEGMSYLSNSHSKDSEAGAGYLLAQGLTFRGHNHSHPYTPNPSEADCRMVTAMTAKFGSKVPTQIYHKGQYHKYNLTTFEANRNIPSVLRSVLKSWGF